MATYQAKRDLWIMALFWICALFFTYVALTVHKEPVAYWMKIFATVYFIAMAALFWWLSVLPFRTYYVLNPDELLLQFGSKTHQVPLSEITEVYPTKNPLSAPAWSLDRIRIKYTSSRFGLLIAVEEKEAFFQELQSLIPGLEWQGKRLVNRDA